MAKSTTKNQMLEILSRLKPGESSQDFCTHQEQKNALKISGRCFLQVITRDPTTRKKHSDWLRVSKSELRELIRDRALVGYCCNLYRNKFGRVQIYFDLR